MDLFSTYLDEFLKKRVYIWNFWINEMIMDMFLNDQSRLS